MPDFVLLARLDELIRQARWLAPKAFCREIDRLIADIAKVAQLTRNAP